MPSDFRLLFFFGSLLLFFHNVSNIFLDNSHFILELVFDEGVKDGVFAVGVDIALVHIFATV